MNNPYTSRGPLPDGTMFYGRANELAEIATYIRGNQSVSIIGPRNIGKSSLMLHLMRDETKAVLGIGVENLFVYIDCQAFSSFQKNGILSFICSEIIATLQNIGVEPETALETAVSNTTWSSFEVAIRKLNQRGLRVVIILDEFESLTTNPHLDVNFYNALRSIAGRLRVVYLTCSNQPLIQLTYIDSSQKIYSSPFFNIFAQIDLG